MLFTFTTLTITTFISAYVKNNISHYVSIVGTFCSIVVVIIIPGMIYIKGNDYPVYHYKNILTIIFIFTIASIGMISIFCVMQKL